ncbi:MAG: hypothetical protein QW794_04360 [Thermosphaera sp.]
MCEPPETGSVCCSDECVIRSTLIALVSVALVFFIAGAPALVHLPEELGELGACINRGEQVLLEPTCAQRFYNTASLLAYLAVPLALMLVALNIIRKPEKYFK